MDRRRIKEVEAEHGKMWFVQTLEPWYAHRQHDDWRDARNMQTAGARIWVADSRLQRVEPPAEDIEIEQQQEVFA
jgi:hypothetical protein